MGYLVEAKAEAPGCLEANVEDLVWLVGKAENSKLETKAGALARLCIYLLALAWWSPPPYLSTQSLPNKEDKSGLRYGTSQRKRSPETPDSFFSS